MTDSDLDGAREKLDIAESVLITAGAGMGVDSGLPDFRGTTGFWKAYPPYEKLGLDFISVASPDSFRKDPAFGWGFYGHRFNLYRTTKPHRGFHWLRQFGEGLSKGCFVFTSNVDGHFQKAGFREDRVLECHGSIRHCQCIRNCGQKIWTADGQEITIDESTMTAQEPLPACPDCGGPARPAILMFGDWEWEGTRTERQEARYQAWLETLGRDRLVIIELGAGRAVPTVRVESEQICRRFSGFLIRINPRESEIPPGINGCEMPLGALEALRLLRLNERD